MVILFMWAASADKLHRARKQPAPLPPTNDSFYLPKPDWQDAKPGDILATREIEAGFTQVDKINLQGAYQILYRTSGTDKENPSFSVTTVLVPHNPRTNKLVMILPYEDANSPACAPSFKIQLGAPLELNPIQSVEELMWTSVLNDGWIATIPDHEGPLSAFASGMVEGHATLDAARATLAFDKLKMDPKSPIVGMGYSGGAIAGGWAASLKDSYAPELNVVGWAIGGTPSNLTSTFYGLDGGLFAGFATAGIAGVVDTYPEVNDYVGSVITPEGNAALQYTREHCMGEIVTNLQGVNITQPGFIKNGREFLKDPQIQKVLETLAMGSNKDLTPKVPLYMYHAVHDEVIPFDMANHTANLWCENGANVQFQQYTGMEMGHVSTEALNTPLVLKFIRDRMDDKPFPSGCHWNATENPLWKSDILGARLVEVFNSILNLMGAKVGQSDAIIKESIGNGTFAGK